MESFKMESADGLILCAYKFIPSNVKSALLILHGSIEHAQRYFDIAEYFCENNIAVYTFDQRGHGCTAENDEDVAYFSDGNDGWDKNIADIDMFVDLIKQNHPNVPCSILGHSMGSFLTRTYIARHSGKVDKAILSGTADISGALLGVGKALCNTVIKFRGQKYRSNIIHKLLYGTLNNRIKNPRTPCDFISHDEAIVDKYIADNRCGNLVTSEYGREMLKGMHFNSQPSTYDMVDKNTSIFIVSGYDDPLAGKNHVDLNRVIAGYKKANIKDLQIKIYDNMRHEIINEVDRKIVYNDILQFILK